MVGVLHRQRHYPPDRGTRTPAAFGTSPQAPCSSLLAGESSGQPINDTMIHHSMDGLFAVRSGPWKLVNGLGSGGFSEPRREEPKPGEAPGQLFNLDDDMSEQNNLYQTRPDIVQRLISVLPSQQN